MRRGNEKAFQGWLMGTKLGLGPGAELATQKGCLDALCWPQRGWLSKEDPHPGIAYRGGLNSSLLKFYTSSLWLQTHL